MKREVADFNPLLSLVAAETLRPVLHSSGKCKKAATESADGETAENYRGVFLPNRVCVCV